MCASADRSAAAPPFAPLPFPLHVCSTPARVSITKRSCSTIPSEWNVVESRLMTHVLCFRLEKTVPVTDSGRLARRVEPLFGVGSLGICLSLLGDCLGLYFSNRIALRLLMNVNDSFLPWRNWWYPSLLWKMIKNWFDCFCNFFEIVKWKVSTRVRVNGQFSSEILRG